MKEKDIERLKGYFETVCDYCFKQFDVSPAIMQFDYASINTDYYYVEFHNKTPVKDYDNVGSSSNNFDVMLYDPNTYTLNWIIYKK